DEIFESSVIGESIRAAQYVIEIPYKMCRRLSDFRSSEGNEGMNRYDTPPHLFTTFTLFLSPPSLCLFLTLYSSEQVFFLVLAGLGQSTARMASSNTVFRPRWVKAEHS
ncbi:Hypothetical protein SMAX5B_012982, partial [Scophthalmus maximus]